MLIHQQARFLAGVLVLFLVLGVVVGFAVAQHAPEAAGQPGAHDWATMGLHCSHGYDPVVAEMEMVYDEDGGVRMGRWLIQCVPEANATGAA